jgi:adenylate cyclase
MVRKLAAGLALGAFAALVVLGLGTTGALETAELKTYDWRMRRAANPASANPAIVLVGINDTTIRDMEPIFGHWPWPRLALSFVVDYLRRAPAKVVAVDLILGERDKVDRYDIGGDTWSGSDSDRALADSVRQSGNVIMLADAVQEGLASGERDPNAATWPDPGYKVPGLAESRPVVLVPYQALSDASIGFGHNFIVLDPDGPARRMAPFIEHDGKYLPSLGVAAALRAGGFHPDEVSSDGGELRIRDRRIPLTSTDARDSYAGAASHRQRTMLIDYRAPTLLPDGKRPYPYYEFRHLFLSEQQLLAGEKPLVDPAVFKDKVVFLGMSAYGLLDVFNTPFGAPEMPGIQLHASMADSILANRFIRPAGEASRVLIVVITALGVGLLSAFLPFTGAALASAAILGGWTFIAMAAFRSGVWLTLVQPLIGGAIALFAGTAYQYFVEGREKRKVKGLFGRYVSRDVFAQLMAHPEMAALGGTRREMTVLFSDIRGFTTVTERGNPEEIVAQLNEYFSKMVDVVFRHHGTLDKFVGDMVMALFGAPLDDPDHADHAVAAAVDMVQELAALNRAWAAAGMAQLDIGIGLNSGDMIAGNIGSSSIMSYTVIGDNVNLGSRLESLNKEYKTRIIMSDATRTRLTQSYDTRPLGDVVVKGKSTPVSIYEITVPTPLVVEASTL